ncbi:MAG: DNA adenine methylase [Leptolyngbyaceae cyanobacterium]
MPLQKPLITYYGGKQRLAPRIVPVLEGIPHTVYSEPFFGGGAIFFARTKPVVTSASHYREVINDRSELLVNLYRVARAEPARFSDAIQMTPYARSEHARAVSICKNPEGYSDFDKAWAYYVNIQQSFCHKLSSGWGTSVFSQSQAATWGNATDRIPECLERLLEVNIECDDALSVIKRWDSPQTLLYLDPPYPGTNQGHYGGYGFQDWQALCELLDSCQSSFVLSGYAQEIEPQSTQQRIEYRSLCSASGKGKVGKSRDRSRAAKPKELGDRSRTEVIWVCDRSAAMRPELQKVVAKQRRSSP